jgi:tetratricopeptide (TPR) repeat protein
MEARKRILIIQGGMFVVFTGMAAVLLIGSTPSTHPVRMIIALGFIIGAGAIVARAGAYIMTKKSGSLLYPSDSFLKPPPATSQAQARRIKGDFEAAMELYTAIVADYPRETRAWIAMVEIALENLKDVSMATDILKRALAVTTAQGARKALQCAFDEKMEALPHKSATGRCD